MSLDGQCNSAKDSQAVGAWTDDEHKKFLKALERVPATCHNRWKMIAALIPTRNATQVRTHAIKYFRTVARRQAREAKRMAMQHQHLQRFHDKNDKLDANDFFQLRASWSPSVTDSIRNELGLSGPVLTHRLSEDDCIDWLVNYYATAPEPLPAPIVTSDKSLDVIKPEEPSPAASFVNLYNKKELDFDFRLESISEAGEAMPSPAKRQRITEEPSSLQALFI